MVNRSVTNVWHDDERSDAAGGDIIEKTAKKGTEKSQKVAANTAYISRFVDDIDFVFFTKQLRKCLVQITSMQFWFGLEVHFDSRWLYAVCRTVSTKLICC